MTTDTATLMQDPRTEEIIEIVAKECNVPREKLVPEATIEELGIASLDMVQTIFAIESKYNVEIPVVEDQQGAEFKNVGGLLAHVLATLDKAQTEQA